MSETTPVFRLHWPTTAEVPLVFDSPHSGSWFPDDFRHCRTERELRDGEDCFIQELFGAAPAHGAPLLEASFARTYVDANRAETDIDTDLIDGQWPHPLTDSGKGKSGQALVWRNLSDGRPIYARKLSVAEMQHRIEQYLRPYQSALKGLIEQTHARHGVSYHINCHSLQSVGGKMSQDGEGTRRADIVLGDRDGSSCSAEFTEVVRAFFANAGYGVKINDPYKGVELVRAFSDPAAGRHSLQIELNRALYMNEKTLEKNNGFKKLQDDLSQLIAQLAQFARSKKTA